MSFLPLDLTDPESIETVISHIDFTMQYGEAEEPKEVRYFKFINNEPLRLTCFSLVQPRDLDEGDFHDMM